MIGPPVCFRRLLPWIACLGLLCRVSSGQLAPGGKTAIGLNIDINEQSLVNLAAYMRILDAKGQDANGWPTSDFNLVLDNRYTFAWAPEIVNVDPLKYSTNLAGHYRLTFNGTAVVSGARNSQYDPATNTTAADYEIIQPRDGPGSLFVEIGFERTRRTPQSAPGSGVTNIRLIRVENEKASARIFTDLWLDSIRKHPWAVLRVMAAMHTNEYGSPGSAEAYPRRLNWTAERRLPGTGPLYGNVSAGVHGILAWEDLVVLAQLTRKDLWIDIPVNASDGYVDKLADLFKYGSDATGRAGIPADVHLYVEYSNELWHDQFPQGKWNSQAARDEVKAGGTNLNYDAAAGTPEKWRFRRIAKRTVEIGRQFRKAFSDDPERIRPVINNQETANDFDMLRYVTVNYGKPDGVLYGISQEGYYTSADSSSPRKILEGERIASDRNRPGYVLSRMLATYFGLHSLAYEGGPNETGPGLAVHPEVPDPMLPSKFAAARDPGMRNIVLHDLIDNWFASGGELYLAFSQVTRYSFWGMFGQTEDLSNLKTGKWTGHVAAMETPVPPLSAGAPLPAVAGASVEIDGNPQARETVLTPGPGPAEMFLLRASVAGTYSFALRGKALGTPSTLRLMLDNSLAGTTALPLDAERPRAVNLRLKPGLHALFVFLDGKSKVAVPPTSRLTVTAIAIQK
jgi:hypothetical protein